MNVIISGKHFIFYLVVMMYSETALSLFLFLSKSLCFLNLIVSQSAINLVFSSMSLLKTNWTGEVVRVLWWVLQIAYTTHGSTSLHGSSASKSYCCRFLVWIISQSKGLFAINYIFCSVQKLPNGILFYI